MKTLRERIPIGSSGSINIGISFESDDIRRVIIYVHGGPGYANTRYLNNVLFRDILNSNENTAIIFWDQSGSGSNFRIYDVFRRYKIDNMVSELSELVKHAKDRFGAPVYIVAHSFGTLLSAEYLKSNDSIAGYIGIAQVIDGIRAEKDIFRYLEKHRYDLTVRSRKILDSITEPPHTGFKKLFHLIKTRKLLAELGSNESGARDSEVNFGVNRIELIRYYAGFLMSLYKLWNQCLFINLNEERGIRCKALFISGTTDYVCPAGYVDEYIKRIDSEDNNYAHIKYKNHGHRSHIENKIQFINDLTKFINKDSYCGKDS